MNTFLNIVIFSLIALLVIENHLLIAGLFVLWFTYRAGAVALIPLAFCIDGYFGAFAAVPYFSIGASIWYLLSEWIRPRLIMQSQSTLA